MSAQPGTEGSSSARGASCAEPKAQEAPRAEDDPSVPGCALIRRAFELGYAKSLGHCAETKRAVEETQICTLRQRDEPYLHYAYRLLSRFGGRVRQATTASALAGLRHDFEEKVDHLADRYDRQRQVMATAPHASHHIWT